MDLLDRFVVRALDLEIRDPFAAISKRPPGYGLELKIQDRLAFIALLLGVMTASAALLIIVSFDPMHIRTAMWIMFAIAAAAAFITLRTSRPLISGLRGERHVGQVLSELEKSGAKILHDVQGEGFNVDHVVISGAGVFAIETKYIGKPKQGKGELVYDGEAVRLGAVELFNDGIKQAKGCAMSVAKTLKQLGEEQSVRAVVIFPGYYVKGKPASPDGVWAQNENYFVRRVAEAENKPLTALDVERIYAKLCARLEQPRTLS